MNPIDDDFDESEYLESLLKIARTGTEDEVEHFVEESNRLSNWDFLSDWLDDRELASFESFTNFGETPGMLNFSNPGWPLSLYLTENGCLVSSVLEDGNFQHSFEGKCSFDPANIASAIVSFVIENHLDAHLAAHFNWNEQLTQLVDMVHLESLPTALHCKINEKMVPLDKVRALVEEQSEIYRKVADFLHNPSADRHIKFREALDSEGDGSLEFLF